MDRFGPGRNNLELLNVNHSDVPKQSQLEKLA